MSDRQTLYSGVSRAAWGYFFLYFDLNLGPVNVLPDFIGMLLFLSAIRLLREERRDLLLLRPLGRLLACWKGAEWVCSWVGISLKSRFGLVSLVIAVASLYFHFQMFTDFAALAQTYQKPGDTIDARLLRWRTIQTVLITAMAMIQYPMWRDAEWMGYVAGGLAVVGLIAGFCLMAALFALRKVFQEEEPVDLSQT